MTLKKDRRKAIYRTPEDKTFRIAKGRAYSLLKEGVVELVREFPVMIVKEVAEVRVRNAYCLASCPEHIEHIRTAWVWAFDHKRRKRLEG